MNVNGNEYSWSSLLLRAFGVEVLDVKGVKFADEIEGRDPVYGASRLPRGRTAGRYKVGDCSMTLYLSGWQALLGQLPDGYGDVETEIVVQYQEGDDIHEVVLERCRLGGTDQSSEEGTDAAEVELSFSCMAIKRDGKYLL